MQKLRGDLKQDHEKLADAEEHLRQSQESKVKANEKANEAVTVKMCRRLPKKRATLKWN